MKNFVAIPRKHMSASLKVWVAVLVLGCGAFAQTLVETTTVMAIQSTLYQEVGFPKGAYKVTKGDAAILKKIPNASKYAFEIYAAKGLTAKLQPAFVHQIVTSFVASGFVYGNPTETKTADELQTLYTFDGEDGAQAVLFVLRKGDTLVYAIGKPKP